MTTRVHDTTRRHRDGDGGQRPRRRRLRLALGLVASLFFLFGWFDQSAVTTVELGTAERVLVISSAGAVEVTTGEVSSLTRRDSWLFSAPRFELADRAELIGADLPNGEFQTVARVTCPGRFPCRSTLQLVVRPGTEVVVVASGGVVNPVRFDGTLTVFSTSDDGVVMGPIVGSARVTSRDGEIRGSNLGLDDLRVETEASVQLSYADWPQLVEILAGEGSVLLEIPQRFYRVEVETPSSSVNVNVNQSVNSNLGIVVRSLGPVSVVPAE